jgi:tetratricopeptide (TPR) repeat protein
MDRYSLADAHIRRAFQLCAGRPTEHPWLKAEVSVSAARLAAATGEYKTANDLARRSCVELRSWAPSSHEPRITEALVKALNLSSQIAMSSGKSAEALTFTSEASTLLKQLQNPEIAAQAETQFFAGMAQLIAGNYQRAEANLWACYELAVSGGQTRDALAIAALLAGYWRLTDRPEEVIGLLSPLMCIARSVAVGDVFGGFLIELGNSAADLQDSNLAQKCLEELNASRYKSPWIQAHAAMLEARVCLAGGHFSAALLASESAESAFVRIGADRLVGPALLIQAESLVKLGERARALRTVEVAIRRLRATGEHYRRLIRAYLVMSALSGDVSLKWKAREMQAALERSVPLNGANRRCLKPSVLETDAG